MENRKWNAVTSEDVLQAIHIYDTEHPEHPEARNTFLLYNRKNTRLSIFVLWLSKYIMESKFLNPSFLVEPKQQLSEVHGQFGLDLSRMGGPDTIWKNKDGMRAEWRDNVEWLIASMQEESS